MKKLKFFIAGGIISISAISCNMKSSDRAELEKMRALDSLENAMEAEMRAEKNTYSRSSSSNTDFNSPTYEPSDPVAYRAEKKRMSNTTKGALIGAGVGAASGAVIAKKPVKGAVLGGVIGAGAGAVTGQIYDKKNNQ